MHDNKKDKQKKTFSLNTDGRLYSLHASSGNWAVTWEYYVEFAAAFCNCALHCPLDAHEASCTVDTQHWFYHVQFDNFC